MRAHTIFCGCERYLHVTLKVQAVKLSKLGNERGNC